MSLLDLVKDLPFSGRSLSESEVEILREALPEELAPAWFLELWQGARLTGQSFDLEADQTLHGRKVAMRWLRPMDVVEESKEYYPGLAAAKLGYLTIGSCEFGSGNPFYLKVSPNWEEAKVVQIQRDAVTDKGTDKESIRPDGIVEIAPNLQVFFEAAELD